MKIIWYGHSCFKVESECGSVIFDPYAPGTVPGIELPPLAADLVICSHGHSDHSYADGVKLSRRKSEFKLTQVKTFHDGERGRLRGENTVTLIEAEGIRLAHLGDLGHVPGSAQLEALGAVDVLFLPVGGFYTIDAAQAKKVADALGARLVIPMHYRGDGFGFDVLSTVDDYATLAGDVRYFDSNELEISAPPEKMTAVLRCPLNDEA